MARTCFTPTASPSGTPYPNYDAPLLATAVCHAKVWDLIGTRFYTGVPDPNDDPFGNHFWSGKLAVMGRMPGVKVFSRALRYRNQVVTLPDGTQSTFLKGEEKGIDVRIALDVIRMATGESSTLRSYSAKTKICRRLQGKSGKSRESRTVGSRSPRRSPSAQRHGTDGASTTPIGFASNALCTMRVSIYEITEQ